MNRRDHFEKFTERSRKVLSLAQEEAQRFNHNYIGTEHLLLGLVREGQGVAAVVLKNLDVDLTKARRAVEAIIGRGDRIVLGEIGLTPRAKKVIELAVDESRRLNHHYIGTEHLLLGLILEGEGIAAGVLTSLGVNLEKARTQTIQVLSRGSTTRETLQQSEEIVSPVTSAGPRVNVFTHQMYHISSEAPDKTPIGAKARQESDSATMLGWVTINTGEAFTLTLYHGMAADAPKVAVITNPPTGASFPFECLLENGLAYTLTGTPGSVSVVYGDIQSR
jgi:ATP-dependent Clp protease ATP-binding subunit ClpA